MRNMHRKSKRYDDAPAAEIVGWALDALPDAVLNPALSGKPHRSMAIDLTALYAVFNETPREEILSYLTERNEQYKLTNVSYAILAGKPGTEEVTFTYPLLAIQGDKKENGN